MVKRNPDTVAGAIWERMSQAVTLLRSIITDPANRGRLLLSRSISLRDEEGADNFAPVERVAAGEAAGVAAWTNRDSWVPQTLESANSGAAGEGDRVVTITVPDAEEWWVTMAAVSHVGANTYRYELMIGTPADVSVSTNRLILLNQVSGILAGSTSQQWPSTHDSTAVSSVSPLYLGPGQVWGVFATSTSGAGADNIVTVDFLRSIRRAWSSIRAGPGGISA